MKLAAMIKKMCQSDSELSIPAKNCYRMVVLGSSKVGKTAIVSRFLTGRFEDAYTPTIEDFHRKFYCIRGEIYQLDILDTSGNHPFPAMRRLSILTGEPGRPGSGRGRERAAAMTNVLLSPALQSCRAGSAGTHPSLMCPSGPS
ncbi:dexamethasone-induced Ras-related protein 1 [Physeter macrocephalus]|uniref:Dexamethasone-induced Ras-related protein 1 n=1 Tax=Physeter macrocephalus TaxID=9755 RepID=A0A9W2X2W6_PHYMC|nr:dexamethasone-induced Ras-related protein 1 [Physeter catodon]